MRVVIVEQWSILRSGLRTVLTQGGHGVLGTADTAEVAVDVVSRTPGVELAVLGSVDRAAPVLVQDLRAAVPDLRTLVFLDHPRRRAIDELLGSGAEGVIDHATEAPELLDAIERIHRGERVLSNAVIDVLAGVSRRSDDNVDRHRVAQEVIDGVPLTVREREILGCLLTGATNRDIAARLFIGESTVKSHLGSTYAKLGVANRQQAVLRAAQLGLVRVG